VVVACALGVGAAGPGAQAPSAYRVRVLRFVDHTRAIRLPNGRSEPRALETVVRYPAAGGPYPLIVFAHGFALTPAPYAGLLRYWTRAGYVVAAPVFPLEDANAPGGPTESDLVNEPRDISVVISRMLAMSAQPSGVLAGRIDPARIAVAGHSDGAVAALGAAYDGRYRDRRIDAAIVLSGATFPGMSAFPVRGPPLLAVQGTADTTNAPATTAAYYDRARRPKFLLWLLGASHLPPYTDEEPQLGIVERATTAFLGHYLKGRSLRLFEKSARHGGLTRLVADP
jgi:fermentation-respiration switch protein FrsA (DUF1100 family)